MTSGPSQACRLCVVTRGDLLPPVHGAAVKITRTATALAGLGVPNVVVMADQDHYLRSESSGGFERCPLPMGCGAMPATWQRVVGRVLRGIGYPPALVRWYRVLLDPKFILRVLEVARYERSTILQADFPQYALAAVVAGRLLRAPVVVVEHNVEWSRLGRIFKLPQASLKRLRTIELTLLKRADHVVAVSDVDARLLANSGIQEELLSVIPLGVDTTALGRPVAGDGFRERLGIPPDAPAIFFHGIHSYRPNAEGIRFICERLLPQLWAQGLTGVRAVVAGEPHKAPPVHPGVIYPGFVEDLPEAMAACDVAVVPLWAGGGTRMKILEYFAGGLPVVSTRKGAEGIPLSEREICIVEDADADGFVRATRELLEDAGQRARLAEAGRRFAQSYDWVAVTGKYVDLFDRLLRNGSAREPSAADERR